MESIPLIYQIIFIIVINTIIVSLVAYLICKRGGRKKIKAPVSPIKSNETNKGNQTISGLGKSETEVVEQYQKPGSIMEKKNLSQEKRVNDKKRQKYLRYTLSGYINIEEDKDKKKSKWR